MPHRDARAEAADLATPAARLRQLLDEHPEVEQTRLTSQIRQAIASNPSTPDDALLGLASEFPVEVLKNPAFALMMMLDPALLRQADVDSQEALARCPELPPLLFDQLLRGPPGVLFALLKNPALPGEIAAHLAVHHDASLRQQAALHPHLPRPWYELLRRAGASADLREVGGPPQLFDDAAWRLLLGHHGWSFELAAHHPALPPWAMEIVVQHSTDPGDRRVIQRLASRADLPEPIALQILARHTFSSIREALAAHQPLDRYPALFARLQEYDYPAQTSIRRGFARNPTTPQPMLRRLVEDIHLAPLVLENPGFPEREVEATAYKPGWMMRQIAAGSSRLAPVTLARLASDGDERVRMVVARNPRTPRESLLALTRDRATIVRERAYELLNQLPRG